MHGTRELCEQQSVWKPWNLYLQQFRFGLSTAPGFDRVECGHHVPLNGFNIKTIKLKTKRANLQKHAKTKKLSPIDTVPNVASWEGFQAKLLVFHTHRGKCSAISVHADVSFPYFFHIFPWQRIGTWRQRNCVKMRVCISLRVKSTLKPGLVWSPSTAVLAGQVEACRNCTEAEQRYWGLSEVEFILKTMSNAKVHDELACGAYNCRL